MVQYIKLYIIFFLCLGIWCQAQYITPEDYEVKLFLDSNKILEPNSMNLQTLAKQYFNIQSQYNIVMQFLDSSARECYNQEWLIRIRIKDNKPILEITYKYRIPIVTNLQDALKKAKELGWDSSETSYSYQVDWGYEKQTLAISKEKEVSNKSNIKSLPTPEVAKNLVSQYIPGKLEKWGKRYLGIENWAKNILQQAHIYGPVSGIRYTGLWNLPEYGKVKIYIEVWNIAGTVVTEISTKIPEYAQAEKVHTLLKKYLKQQNWLLEKDILKTTMVFDAYSK